MLWQNSYTVSSCNPSIGKTEGSNVVKSVRPRTTRDTISLRCSLDDAWGCLLVSKHTYTHICLHTSAHMVRLRIMLWGPWWWPFSFLETGFQYVTLAVLELTIWTRVAILSQLFPEYIPSSPHTDHNAETWFYWRLPLHCVISVLNQSPTGLELTMHYVVQAGLKLLMLCLLRTETRGMYH